MKKAADNVPWTIPDDCRLPDTVEEIERGREPKLRQTVLFDDSLMARLRAIKSHEPPPSKNSDLRFCATSTLSLVFITSTQNNSQHQDG